MYLSASLRMCNKKYFTYKEFYKVIDCFMNNKDLTVTNISGEGSIITYQFEIDKDRVWIKFNQKYDNLSLDLETDSSLESFVGYVKELELQLKDRFVNKKE